MNDFINRRYQPVLKNIPLQYIHEPWNAPESVQRAAKCIIGKDYPLPMVNHTEVSRLNIERMKQVYQRLTQFRGTGNKLSISNLKFPFKLTLSILLLKGLSQKPIGNSTNNMTTGKKLQQHQQQDASYNQNVLQIHQDYNK